MPPLKRATRAQRAHQGPFFAKLILQNLEPPLDLVVSHMETSFSVKFWWGSHHMATQDRLTGAPPPQTRPHHRVCTRVSPGPPTRQLKQAGSPKYLVSLRLRVAIQLQLYR